MTINRGGSFFGDGSPGNIAAQMITLLHEFGHQTGLLPSDGKDVKLSMANTEAVKAACGEFVGLLTAPAGP